MQFARGAVDSLQCFVDISYEEKRFYDVAGDRLSVVVSPYYFGRVEGLCGNYDGNPGNDS